MFGFALRSASPELWPNARRRARLVIVIDVRGRARGRAAALWLRRDHPLAVGWRRVVGCSAFSGPAGAAARCAICSRSRSLPAAPDVPGRAAGGLRERDLRRALHAHARFNYRTADLLVGWSRRVVAAASGVRARPARAAAVAARAHRRLQDEQQLRVREAQLAERARIAREMHDVLAHRISLLSVHAGALEFNPTPRPRRSPGRRRDPRSAPAPRRRSCAR